MLNIIIGWLITYLFIFILCYCILILACLSLLLEKFGFLKNSLRITTYLRLLTMSLKSNFKIKLKSEIVGYCVNHPDKCNSDTYCLFIFDLVNELTSDRRLKAVR